MTLKNLFESIWNYDFSNWFVYLAIAFGVLINLVCVLRLAANIFKFKEIEKDLNYFLETIGIMLFLVSETFVAYKIYFE